MTNIAIIGLQWGDEGKGKIVDFLADKFDAVVRFQGGHNAGHTIKVGNSTYKLSLLPSGIIQGKFSVIGSGVVLDPLALLSEINKLKEMGVVINNSNLAIADNCGLILSIHRELDQLLEVKKGENKIGTTGRGIGPAYEDICGRRAIRICDLCNQNILNERIENLLFYHNLLRKSLGALEISSNQLIEEINQFRDDLLPMVQSSFVIAQKLMNLNSVMFEGAQGALLDVNYGTFPFVTSSNTIAGQVAIGSTLGVKNLDKTIGVVKAYTTRVGSGPFPTELNDEIGEFLRINGNEVGTVTGRNRRCGWFDAALIKKSIQLSSVNEVALTKLDVLDQLKTIKICVAYKINDKIIDYMPNNIADWSLIEPIYEEFEGWQSSTLGINSRESLPQNAKKYISYIENLCKVRAVIISTGANREQTILEKI